MSTEINLIFLHAWFYTRNRAIFWLGPKGSHYSERKRYIKTELGEWGRLGLKVTCGGEDKEIMLFVGLGLFSLYLSITNIFTFNKIKIKNAAKEIRVYEYEIDYSSQGRDTGIVFKFREPCLTIDVWSGDSWNDKKPKFKNWPYCLGWSYSVYFLRSLR